MSNLYQLHLPAIGIKPEPPNPFLLVLLVLLALAITSLMTGCHTFADWRDIQPEIHQ